MKHVLIIGIGAGNPDYLTLQAIDALRRADVFFVMDKGAVKEKLIVLRREIIERHAGQRPWRIVESASPERGPDGDSYVGAVEQLNRDKQQVFERLIGEELRDGECGAFLVWGDPALYDSTMRIVAAIAAGGRHDFEHEVIPGISSVQALAARHRIALNEIGRAVEIVNGRGLGARLPEAVDSVVVMLARTTPSSASRTMSTSTGAPTWARPTRSWWRGVSPRSSRRSCACGPRRARATAGSWIPIC